MGSSAHTTPLRVAHGLLFPVLAALSWLVLATCYFGIVLPIGLLARLALRDPLRRTLEPGRESYWTDYVPPKNVSRYDKPY
ncbi:MAG: hypothetical protein H6832_16525 [Planctomycetes bacterium]|nr:hypothetical protein [Planctomycetota bacterium]MCB9920009.1 hypothetical protein [Planctomycetota bacterium]